MRKDMTKRFLEPSRGPQTKFPRHCKAFNKTDEDGNFINSPRGMKRIHRLTIKSEDYGDIGTDLSFLRRFLQSKIGQSWNDIYSEICSEADLRSFPGHHLREFLEMEVEQNCTISDDGEVLDHRGNHVKNSHWEKFYVHPKTGILEFDGKKKWKRTPPEQSVFEMDGIFYHEHNGVWYRVKMQELKKVPSLFLGSRYMVYDEWHAMNDVMIKELSDSYPWRVVEKLEKEYGHSPNGKVWFCEWKQSANSKEIAKIKKLSQAA